MKTFQWVDLVKMATNAIQLAPLSGSGADSASGDFRRGAYAQVPSCDGLSSTAVHTGSGGPILPVHVTCAEDSAMLRKVPDQHVAAELCHRGGDALPVSGICTRLSSGSFSSNAFTFKSSSRIPYHLKGLSWSHMVAMATKAAFSSEDPLHCFPQNFVSFNFRLRLMSAPISQN